MKTSNLPGGRACAAARGHDRLFQQICVYLSLLWMSGLHSSCDGDGLYSVFDFNTHFFPKCSAGLPDSDPAD